MRGLYSTSEGRVTYQPPLHEAEDAERFCPHCHGRLGKTRKPTILPPPWFDHVTRQVIVGDERRKVPDGIMFRMLVIFWERPERLLSPSALISLLYSDPDTAPRDKVVDIYLVRLRRLLTGTPYSIINRHGEGYIFTHRPPDAREIARRKRLKAMRMIPPALAFAVGLLIAALADSASAQQASDPAVSTEFLTQFKALHADTAADLALAQARQVVTSRELQAARTEIAKLHQGLEAAYLEVANLRTPPTAPGKDPPP